jgi:hypothetical protein
VKMPAMVIRSLRRIFPHVLSCRRRVPRQHDLLRERAVSSYCRNESRCAAILARGTSAVAILAGGWCSRRAAHRATEGITGDRSPRRPPTSRR